MANLNMSVQSYWDRRYTEGVWKSGYGSYGEQLKKKLKWLSGLDIKSVSEVGCGDFNFGKHLLEIYPHALYAGHDISNVIIERNRIDYPQYFFYTRKDIASADLLLCIDVLFHVLDDEEYEQILDILEKKWTKYLAITAYEEEQYSSPHLKIRKFDYKRFGKPIIRKVVEKEGSLYFYLWKK